MQHNALIYALYQIGVIKFEESESHIELDLRKIISYPQILRSVSSAIWQKIYTRPMEAICGVAYTAIPIATCMSLQHDIPLILCRHESSNMDSLQRIEGKYTSEQHCIIIQDVMNTGQSVIETAAKLQEVGVIVKDVAVLIDRQQGGKENLEKEHYMVHAVFTVQEVLRQMLHSNLLIPTHRSIVTGLMEEFNKK